MPGVGMRACSSSTNVFQNADERPGERGHHHGVVDVGDDAEVDVGADDPDRRLDRLRRPRCAASRDASRERGRPGRACRPRRRGRRAPRGARPPTSMTTGTSPTGTLVKLRQPRMPCSPRLRRRFDGSSGAIGPAEQHAAEHADPFRRSVARVRARSWARDRAGAPSARGRRGSSPRCARHDAGPRAHGTRPGWGDSPASTQSVMRSRRVGKRTARVGRMIATGPVEWRPQVREVPCRMST